MLVVDRPGRKISKFGTRQGAGIGIGIPGEVSIRTTPADARILALAPWRDT